jgi:hypothetical protein
MTASRFDTRFDSHALPVHNRETGVLITLSTGVISTGEFTARREIATHLVMGQEFGLEVRVSMRDYRIKATDLVVDGATIEPRTGYTITEGAEVFEILPPDDNTPSCERTAGGLEWLVHTKRIE